MDACGAAHLLRRWGAAAVCYRTNSEPRNCSGRREFRATIGNQRSLLCCKCQHVLCVYSVVLPQSDSGIFPLSVDFLLCRAAILFFPLLLFFSFPMQVDWWVLKGGGRGGHPHIDRECKKGKKRDTKAVIQSIALGEEQHFGRNLRGRGSEGGN